MKYFILSILLVFILFLSGCINDVSYKIFIQSSEHDGIIYILKSNVLNKNFNGYVKYNSNENKVGNVLINNDVYLHRSLYKFNLSNLKDGNITFNVYCTNKVGNPGVVDVYIISNDWNLSNTGKINDISNIWKLNIYGKKITSILPTKNKWIKINISKKDLPDRRFLSIMMKLTNEESIGINNYYTFSTYDYSKFYENTNPYLEIS